MNRYYIFRIKLVGEKTTPIIRKVIQVGTSRAVSLPKSWLTHAENKAGKKIIALALEINNVITMSPVFEKQVEYDKSKLENKR